MTSDLRSEPVGAQLRRWRERRRLSQLDLALDADISARHLSFVETGRSAPSRAVLLRLAERLGVPLRERNALLMAAGLAPVYAERALDGPELAPARRAIDQVLRALEPFPAIAIDRHWTLVAANAAIDVFVRGLPEDLLAPPLNVLRLSLHPLGLAPRIRNLGEWRAHILERLDRQWRASGDAGTAALLAELRSYPSAECSGGEGEWGGIAVPLRILSAAGELNLLSTTTVFGTPRDITLEELAIEAFLPADAHTAERLGMLAEQG